MEIYPEVSMDAVAETYSSPFETLVVTLHSDPGAEDRQRFGEFLSRQSGPMLSHHPSWIEIFREGLGHRVYFLEAMRGERTVGLLPLALVRSFLFGRFLISLPYLNQGGPVCEDPEAAKALIDRAVTLAESLDVRYLELRNLQEFDHPALTAQVTSKVLMWRDLPSSSEELWKSFDPSVRNQIRKGKNSSLGLHWGRHELLDDFYAVFSQNMRDLGTPVYHKKLFASILTHLGECAELCVVRTEKLPISAALLLHAEKHTQVPSASSLREYNKTCANMWMYHQLLERAVERGQSFFDFGRSSKDSGTYRFKRQWGAQPQPSIWQYHIRKGDIFDMRPDNPKYRRKIEIWKRLPVWLTRLIGPVISRGIP